MHIGQMYIVFCEEKMKKHLLMILLLSSLFNTNNPMSFSVSAKNYLKHSALGVFLVVGSCALYIEAAEAYKTVGKVQKDPLNNIELVRKFAENYEDHSLALGLISNEHNANSLKNVILYINKIIKEKADKEYFGAICVWPACILAYSWLLDI